MIYNYKQEKDNTPTPAVYPGRKDKNTMEILKKKLGETYDYYCFDCGQVTRQTYRGIYNDGTQMYICNECGCENTETNEE